MPVITNIGSIAARGFGFESSPLQQNTSPYFIGVFSSPSTESFYGGYTAITNDSSGNIYFAAPYVTNSSSNIYIVLTKLTNLGSIVWQKKIYDTTSSSSYFVYGINVSSTGNISIAVNYQLSNGNFYPSIIVCDSSGNVNFAYYLDDGHNQSSFGCSFDSSGNIYLLQNYYNNTYSAGAAGVSKYNSSGTLQWQYFYGLNVTLNNFIGFSIKIDSGSNVLLNCQYNTADVNGSGLIKINSSGTITWDQGYNVTGTDLFGFGCGVDSSNNVYGTFQSGSYYTDGVYSVIKTDSSGNPQFTKSWLIQNFTNGTLNFVNSTGLGCTDSSGNTYVGYNYQNNASSNYVIGITKVNSSGTVVYARQLSTPGSSTIVSMLTYNVNTNGDYYISFTNNQILDSSSSSKACIGVFRANGTVTGTYNIGGVSMTYSSITPTTQTFTGPTPSAHANKYTASSTINNLSINSSAASLTTIDYAI